MASNGKSLGRLLAKVRGWILRTYGDEAFSAAQEAVWRAFEKDPNKPDQYFRRIAINAAKKHRMNAAKKAAGRVTVPLDSIADLKEPFAPKHDHDNPLNLGDRAGRIRFICKIVVHAASRMAKGMKLLEGDPAVRTLASKLHREGGPLINDLLLVAESRPKKPKHGRPSRLPKRSGRVEIDDKNFSSDSVWSLFGESQSYKLEKAARARYVINVRQHVRNFFKKKGSEVTDGKIDTWIIVALWLCHRKLYESCADHYGLKTIPESRDLLLRGDEPHRKSSKDYHKNLNHEIEAFVKWREQ
jgi:hypothetical protein